MDPPCPEAVYQILETNHKESLVVFMLLYLWVSQKSLAVLLGAGLGGLSTLARGSEEKKLRSSLSSIILSVCKNTQTKTIPHSNYKPFWHFKPITK